MIKEVKPKKTPPPKKKPNLFVRILAFLLTAALVLGAILLVVNRDKLNFDALKRWFTYRTLAQSDTTGGGEPFSYQGGSDLTLVNCGGDLLSVCETGVRLYSPGGTAYVEDTLTLSNPVCQVSGKSAVVYDAGGTALRVYRDRALAFELTDNTATILGARLSYGGYLTVVTRASGYKGVVTLYDRSSFRPLLTLRLSSAYVLDALAAPDGRSLLVVTAGQEDRLFSCTLAQYSLSDLDPEEPEPIATWSLGNRLPLELTWDPGGVRVMTEYAALAADETLTETGLFEWPNRYLKRSSLRADNCFVLLTGKYRAGSQTALTVVNREGKAVGALEETRPVLSLSAAGKYVALLTAEELNIYTRDLQLYASVENTQGASHVALLDDGSAYLASGDLAWLYVPN